MFYAQFVLSKKGPLAKIWLAAHWEKKLTKTQVFETNVAEAVDAVLQPKVKMALRTTGHLLLGIVRIYSRKAKYLLADCNEAFLKIKMAFRPGQTDLPEEGREAQLNAITLPEVFHDFDSALPDFNEIDYNTQLSLNQSRIDDITMKEDLPSRSGIDFGGGIDDFGDAHEHLDDFEGLEQLREGSISMHSNLRRSRVDGSRLSVGDLGGPGGSAMDIDTPIPDDFGGNLDDHLFMDEIFNDEEMMREGEELEGLKENQESARGPDETVLLQNADESFALEPLDHTVMQGLEKHKTKRKRKLIVDETKNITGDEMKSQMGDYSDTLVQMDLAPPTKKLMNFKETGTAEKFFYAPAMGDGFVAKRLLKQFATHLVLRCREEDKLARTDLLDELELAKNTEILEEPPEPVPAPFEDLRLSAIPEEPRNSGLLSPGVQLPDQPHDDEPVPSVSPIPATSDRSESPPPQEKKEKQKKERKSRHSQEHSRNTTMEDDEDDEPETRWTKRTQHILDTYRAKLKEQKEVTFTEMTKGATRKSAAQKFYMVLFLKKLQAIKFTQDEPYGEIVIKKGKELYKEL